MNKNLASASLDFSDNDQDGVAEENPIPNPSIHFSTNLPTPPEPASPFDAPSALQPTQPETPSIADWEPPTAENPKRFNTSGTDISGEVQSSVPLPSGSGNPEAMTSWHPKDIHGDDDSNANPLLPYAGGSTGHSRDQAPNDAGSTPYPSAVQEHEHALQKLKNFTAEGEPYVLMNGDPMKITPTVRGPRPIPVSGADEHHEAMNWLNQRAQLQDDVNRLKPAADYEREIAATPNQHANLTESSNARDIWSRSRLGDSQLVTAPKTEAQKEDERVNNLIKSLPSSPSPATDHAAVHTTQNNKSFDLGKNIITGYFQRGQTAFKDADSYARSIVKPRWTSFKDQMVKELDAGRPHEAAVAIRQLYSDLAAGGFLHHQSTAARFMKEWLDNNSDPNRVVKLETSEMRDTLSIPNTQTTLADSLLKQRPDLVKSGERDIEVRNLILPEIQTGEANPDIFHTLGQFTLEFSGKIHRGKTTPASGGTTATPVTFDGTFTFRDTYDWGDSHGKSMDIMGFNIPDSYGNLVEKQGLANRFKVGGSITTKVTGTT